MIDYHPMSKPIIGSVARYTLFCQDIPKLSWVKNVHTCMGSGMSFQIKGVIEAFATKGTEIPLGITVTLHVSVQKPLQTEDFRAQAALKLGWVTLRSGRGQFFHGSFFLRVGRKRIFDSMPTIDEFNGCIRWNTQLQVEKPYGFKSCQLTWLGKMLIDDCVSKKKYVLHSFGNKISEYTYSL